MDNCDNCLRVTTKFMINYDNHFVTITPKLLFETCGLTRKVI